MHKSLLFAFICIFISGCASRQPLDKSKAQLHLKIGTGHLNKGNYPQALEALLNAKKLDPENAIIQNNLGIAYFVRQKYSQAEGHLRKAIAINPRYTDARNNLGRTLIKLGLYQQAIHQLKFAAEDLTYSYPEKSFSNLGIAYFYNKQFKHASVFLKKSLKMRKNHCETSKLYARSLFERHKYQAASLAFDQASFQCQKEKSEDILYYGAMAFFKLDLREEAIARFEEVVGGYPKGNYLQQAQKMLNLLKR